MEYLDIQNLHQQFKKQDLSPVDHLKKTLTRIERNNPEIRAFVHLTEDEAMQAAQEAESLYQKGEIKSPLQGVTVGVKDVIHTKDAPVTLETELYYDQPIRPSEDAFAVKKCREAGAVVVGKVNTHEMGMGPTGDVGYSGHARNPYDLSKVTGGSSSGSAAAVAAGLCDVSLGSDTGGSIRLPSALSGIVGMKPTFGRVSNSGFSPLSYSCDTIGPMTKNVKDNALTLQVIVGYDETNMYSREFPPLDFTHLIGESVEGMRVGIVEGWLEECLDPEYRDHMNDMVDHLKDLSCEVVKLEFPSRAELADLRQSHQNVLISEGYHAHQAELQHPGRFAPDIYLRLLGGNQTSLDYISSYQDKQVLIDLYHQAYESCDLMISPAVMLPACDLYQKEVQVEGKTFTTMQAYTEFTWMNSFTGMPSLSLPTGFNERGLPLGILINADFAKEDVIYQLAAALEEKLGLDLLPGRGR